MPEALELKGHYTYDSGGPYRIWTLIHDIPELLLTQGWEEDVDGPPHAAKGDELWEDKDDRSNHFRLKRDDYVVARPEWWQLRHIFGDVRPSWKRRREDDTTPGLLKHATYETDGVERDAWHFRRAYSFDEHHVVPMGATMWERTTAHTANWWLGKRYPTKWVVRPGEHGTPVHGIPDRLAADLLRVDTIERVSEYRTALLAIGAPFPSRGERCSSLAFVERDIPGVVRRGDVLVQAEQTSLRGVVRGLTMDDYAALAGARDALTDISPCASVDCWRPKVADFLANRRTWGARLKVWRSRLLLVRPVYAEHVSQPIRAVTDEHAVFELLGAVGCRMPAESPRRS